MDSITDALEDLIPWLEQTQQQPNGVSGQPTGFNALDKLSAGWQKSELTVIAAPARMGKTAFALSVISNTMFDGELGVFWYSTNLSKLQLTKMLVCNNLSIGLHTLSTANFNFKLLKNEVGNCKFSNVSFCDAPYLTINDIDKKLSASLELCVDSIVVIDNINQLNYSENCILGLSDKLYQLKTLARKHEISIIGLLDTEISDSHFDDYATAIDFLERNKIFDKSIDTLIQLFRPEYYRITEYIDKSSTIGLAEILFSGRIGKGRIQLNYEPGFYKYKEIR